MAQVSLQRKNRKNILSNSSMESRLREELGRLKRLYDTGYELQMVKWLPNGSREKDGEVRDETIHIYTEASKALRVLRHEFFHYLISKPAKKYEKIVNIQGSLIRSLLAQLLDEAYKEEEFIVEKLVDAHERMEATTF